MCQAGIVLPSASLRWPVSISWLISTRTIAPLPWACARMRIGSDISAAPSGSGSSAAAAAERDLDFLLREQRAPVAEQGDGDHVRRLRHLHAGSDAGLDGVGELERAGERGRVLLDHEDDLP